MKGCVIFFLLLLGITAVNAQSNAAQSEEAQKRYDQFKADYEAAKTKDAVTSAIKHGIAAHKLAPNVFKYPYGVARVYHYLDEYDSCVEWFGKAIELKPDDRLDSAVATRRECEIQLAMDNLGERDPSTLVISFATKEASVVREPDKELIENLPRLLPGLSDDTQAEILAQQLAVRLTDMDVAAFGDYVVATRISSSTTAQRHGERIAPFLQAIRKAHFSSTPIKPIVIVLGRDTYEMVDILERIYPSLSFPVQPYFGFYNHRDRLIMAAVGAGYGSLLHELVHALIAAQFPQAPLWYEESLATVYERTEWRGNELWPLPNWRMDFVPQDANLESTLAGISAKTSLDRQELATLRILLSFAFERGYIREVDTKIRNAPNDYLPTNVLADIRAGWSEFVEKQFLEYRLEVGRNVTYGLSGIEEIRFVQNALNIVIDAGLSEDGIPGPATSAAIERFQRQFGLNPDRMVGSKTMSRLRGELVKRALY